MGGMSMYYSSGLGMLVDSPVDGQLHGGHRCSPVVFIDAGLNQVFFFQGAQIAAAASNNQPVSHPDTKIAALGRNQAA